MPPAQWQFEQTRYDLSDFRGKTFRPPLSMLPEALSQGEKTPNHADFQEMPHYKVQPGQIHPISRYQPPV
jgi:hypothetical protein